MLSLPWNTLLGLVDDITPTATEAARTAADDRTPRRFKGLRLLLPGFGPAILSSVVGKGMESGPWDVFEFKECAS